MAEEGHPMNDMLKTTPDFSIEQAKLLLAEHYGLDGTLSPLDSERDQNFKVSASDGGTYILKLVNAAEPLVESEFQTALLGHIGEHAPELPVPHIRKTVSGASLAEATSAQVCVTFSASSAGCLAFRLPRRRAARRRWNRLDACLAVSMPR
jgi:Ser/Thr protein kinase RdoA (MazF antagonist)